MNGTAAQQRQPGQAGFSLLEVLVATVILGLAYVAVLQSFSLSLTNILRLEESKRGSMAAAVELDNRLRAPAGEAAVAVDDSVYLEGRRHRLMLVSSEDGDLVTLKLVRNFRDDQ